MIISAESISSCFVLAACILIHEGGHLTALRVRNCSVERIDIEPFGASILCDPLTPYRDELITTLAGPVAGLTAAAAGAAAMLLYPSPLLLYFSCANAALSLVNLVPAAPLDGSVILRTLLCLNQDPTTAEKILKRIGVACTAFLAVGAALCIVYSGFNLSLLAMTLCSAAIAPVSGRKEGKRQ